MSKVHARPNVICDCITLEPFMHKLLAQGKTISIVAAYRGEPGYVGIAERAHFRANDINADPADKGRFVETTALFKGHANASRYLLSSVPKNMLTTIYNTSIERGENPVKIGVIDSTSHILEIDDLRIMSEFLNKKNININAINQIDLIMQNNSYNLLTTHEEYKASSLLDLILDDRHHFPYTIKLKDNLGQCYAELKWDHDQINFNIIDQKMFINKATAETMEAKVLRAITRQIEKRSLKDSLDASFQYGDKESFHLSFKNITDNANHRLRAKK